MSKAILCGVLLSTLGCITPGATLTGSLNQFVAEGKARGVVVRPDAVSLVFVVSLPGMAAGRCFPNRSPRLIEVSKEIWDDSFYTDDTRRQLVFHELGHCLLGIREHTLNLASDVFSVGIMESSLIPYERYHGHEAEWLDRLFGVGR